MHRLGTAARSAETQASRLGRIMDISLGNLVAKAALKAGQALTSLARGGLRLLSESVRAAGIQAIANRKLEQALINLGDGSKAAQQHLHKVAQEIQRVSNVGDEATLTAAAMLASFKSVGSAQGIGVLLPRLADMAAGVARVTGETVDLNSVAAAVGKALEGGASALRRYGVSLSDAEARAIDAAEGIDKVNLLAAALDRNFEGLAAATADPFVQMANAVGDAKEALGEGLLPALRRLASGITEAIQSAGVTEALRSLGHMLGDVIDRMSTFVQRGNVEDALEHVVALARATDDLVGAFSDFNRALGIDKSPTFTENLKTWERDLGKIAGLLRTITGWLERANEVRLDNLRTLGLAEGPPPRPGGRGRPVATHTLGAFPTLSALERFGQGPQIAPNAPPPSVPPAADWPATSGAASAARTVREADVLSAQAAELVRLQIEAMEDGLPKILAQIDAEFDRRRAAYREQYGRLGEQMAALMETAQGRARAAAIEAAADVPEDVLEVLAAASEKADPIVSAWLSSVRLETIEVGESMDDLAWRIQSGLIPSLSEAARARHRLEEALSAAGTQEERDKILALIAALDSLEAAMTGVADASATSQLFVSAAADAFAGLAESLGATLASMGDDAESYGDRIRAILSGVASALGKQMIAMGMALLAAGSYAKGARLLAAGGMLTALGGMTRQSPQGSAGAAPSRTPAPPGGPAGGYVAALSQGAVLSLGSASPSATAHRAARQADVVGALDALREDLRSLVLETDIDLHRLRTRLRHMDARAAQLRPEA